MDLKPIGPFGTPVTGRIEDLPDLLLGGAVFNQQFNDHPEQLPAEEILRTGFTHGIRAIDTSPYYGPSEIILGEALKKLKPEIPREWYYIVTKCGRLFLDEFDYSPEWIRKSVLRSLERLDTTYLDLVYLHDIEFVEEDKIFGALAELKKLKDEGIIKHFGLSGYPVDFLFYISKKAVTTPSVGPLDAVLSYSNFNMQNERLRDYISKFYEECKLKKLLCASILSMSLLRSGPTHEFHPASKELRDKCQEVAALTAAENVELADLATRFALREFLPHGPVVLGVSNLKELNSAIEQYWNVKENKSDDDALVKKVKEAFGEHHNEVWGSGIPHKMN
ncbi:CYFA0S09e04258g1_1 [Cyberlindnera fabianii]|uniref:CYFA0S09e04258g1_1 n=1 Tax=Cyberlindnera fabianii TaxID=36022 RepID=A0A061B479_CYBFA|nr:CYFA0S09e04258g1_1 [Cyberlindnera fabianii]